MSTLSVQSAEDRIDFDRSPRFGARPEDASSFSDAMAAARGSNRHDVLGGSGDEQGRSMDEDRRITDDRRIRGDRRNRLSRRDDDGSSPVAAAGAWVGGSAVAQPSQFEGRITDRPGFDTSAGTPTTGAVGTLSATGAERDPAATGATGSQSEHDAAATPDGSSGSASSAADAAAQVGNDAASSTSATSATSATQAATDKVGDPTQSAGATSPGSTATASITGPDGSAGSVADAGVLLTGGTPTSGEGAVDGGSAAGAEGAQGALGAVDAAAIEGAGQIGQTGVSGKSSDHSASLQGSHHKEPADMASPIAALGSTVQGAAAAPGSPTAAAAAPAAGTTHASGPSADLPGGVPEAWSQVAKSLLINRRLADGSRRIALRLDPPDLGGVRLDMSMRSGRLSVLLTADNAAARDQLKGSIDQLRRALEQGGTALGSLEVSAGTSQDRTPRDYQPDGGVISGPTPSRVSPNPTAVPAGRTTRSVAVGSGRLDLRL